MGCEEFREQITLHAGGKDPAPEPVTRHLRECPDCRSRWDGAAGAWELLGAHSAIEPRPDFLSQVRDKISRRWIWRLLAPVAAAAAAVLVAFLLTRPEPSPVLSTEDREIVENLDLLENYEVLQALEVLDEEFEKILEEDGG